MPLSDQVLLIPIRAAVAFNRGQSQLSSRGASRGGRGGGEVIPMVTMTPTYRARIFFVIFWNRQR